MVESPLEKSDHGCVQLKCSIEPQKAICRQQMYMYEKANYSKLCRFLSVKWDEYLGYQDVEVMWDKFKLKF